MKWDLDKFFFDHEDWRPYADLVAMPPTRDELAEEFPDAHTDVLAACEYGDGQITIGALYVRIRREGNGDRFAAMLALQQAPRIMTDSVFFEGQKRLGDTFDEQYLKKITQAAIRNGYRPNPTDMYQPGLARFRGDPEAFVPASGGRGYIKRLCEKRGWACEGAVSAEHRQPDRDPMESCVPMAESLIRENAQRMVQANPDLKRLNKRELRERVLQQHGPRK
jgi:hypothetical protein